MSAILLKSHANVGHETHRGPIGQAFCRVGGGHRQGHRHLRAGARFRAAPPQSDRSPRASVCWSPPLSSSGRCCGASFFRKSTPARSRSTSAPPPAPASNAPRRRSAASSGRSAKPSRKTSKRLSVKSAWLPTGRAAYTPNAGPMDAVVKVQLEAEREHSAQEYVHLLRENLKQRVSRSEIRLRRRRHDPRRGNEEKSTPLNVRLVGKDMATTRAVAYAIQQKVEFDFPASSTPASSSGSITRSYDRHRPGQGGLPGADPG